MRRAATALIALLIATPAAAADFAILSFAGPTPIISIAGPILLNDDLRFEEFAQALKGPAIVRLESIGGNTRAALGIGRTVAQYGYGTYVGEQGVCASACGLIWLAGKPRMASATARVGLHASYVKQDGVDVETGSANALVGRYLGELGFGDEFVVYATAAAPNDMAWLNRSTTDHFGLNWDLKTQDIATLTTVNLGVTSPPLVMDLAKSPQPLAVPSSPPAQPLPLQPGMVDPWSPPKRVEAKQFLPKPIPKPPEPQKHREEATLPDVIADLAAGLFGRNAQVRPVEKAPRLRAGVAPADE